MLELTRREFMVIASMLALSGCGGSSDEKADEPEEKAVDEPEAEPEPIVTEDTYYDVFRVDVQRGILGDVEALTANTHDFSDWYATLDPEGRFNFDINGVPYNGKLTLGGPDKHLYSGIKDAEVTRLLFDGDRYANVGSVDIEGYTVDGYLLIEMVTSVDGEYMDYTFYLWKHLEE